MGVDAADGEANGSLSHASRLALDAHQFSLSLDDQVAAGVLAEGDVEAVAGLVERSHDGELRPVADDLRVLGTRHVVKFAYRSDGTMGAAPE